MGVKLIFIQGPHIAQFNLMWAGSLNRWKEGRQEGRKEGRKGGRTDRRKKGKKRRRRRKSRQE